MAHQEQRTVFSSLDILVSCDTIILVLLPQMYVPWPSVHDH